MRSSDRVLLVLQVSGSRRSYGWSEDTQMPEKLGSVTVLLVEDDVRQSDALRTLFEESSPETTVIVEETLKGALAHDRAGVDAVLLDLGLPDSTGLDTLVAAIARFAP